MSYRTTKKERSARIPALVDQAREGAVQALLELAVEAIGAEVLDAEGHDDTLGAGLPHAASKLAAQVGATFTEQEPAFIVGQAVNHASERRGPGKITDRYLGERDGWEYQVRWQGSGEYPYREDDLAPVEWKPQA